MAMTLKEHAKMPASMAHGANAKGFYKGGKTDADMLKMGRGLAKVQNQKTGMKKP
jgi:hypothetical protein